MKFQAYSSTNVPDCCKIPSQRLAGVSLLSVVSARDEAGMTCEFGAAHCGRLGTEEHRTVAALRLRQSGVSCTTPRDVAAVDQVREGDLAFELWRAKRSGL